MDKQLHKIGIAFESVNNKRQQIIRNKFVQISLTYPQFLILNALEKLQEKKEEVKQVDLADFTRMDVMTVSTIVRNLEKQALISRENSEKDTRAKIIKLTNDGTQKVWAGQNMISQIDDQFFSVLDEYTTMFLTLLNQLSIENREK